MKRIFLHLTLLLCALPSLALAQSARAIPADRIVAIVNEEAITQNELNARIAVVARQMRAQNVELPPQSVMERQMLEKMIIDLVQIQYGRDSGLSISDPELEAAIGRIAGGNKMSSADFRTALERDGISWRKFREEIRDEIMLAQLRQRETESRMIISDSEIDNFLANPANGEAAGQVSIAHVLVRVPEQSSPEQLAKLRARAEQALEKVKAGEDFAKIAATYSDSADALQQGGLIPMRPVDRLPTLYADAVQPLQPGDTSPILRSPAGFHFIKLIERRGGIMQMPVLKQTHARHILIRANEIVSDEEALRKIQSVKERLDNGGDFAELARLYSSDMSAARGGDLGWLYQGDTVPDFEKAMDALEINQVSGPVKSPFGWHLIQVLERRTDEGSPERKRMMARMALRERKSDEVFQDWVRQLRDRAYIEYRTEEQ